MAIDLNQVSPPPAAEGQGEGPQEARDPTEEELLARLDSLGESLGKSRSEAIQYRESTGIENIWKEDQDFYEGVDDANRHENHPGSANWVSKVPGKSATKVQTTTRSRVFPNLTGPFTDAAVARIADMLLPTDDHPFALNARPDPKLLKIVEEAKAMDKKQQQEISTLVGQGISEEEARMSVQQKPEAPQKPGMLQRMNPFTRSGEDPTPITPEEAKALLEVHNQRAIAAQRQIEDWHINCDWHAEVRLMLEDSGRLGVGILKGPVPVVRKRVGWGKKEHTAEIIQLFNNNEIEKLPERPNEILIEDEVNPESERVDPWNFYPAADCGDDIQNGSGTWERKFLTKKMLRDMKQDPTYIESQINKCLLEKPIKATGNFKKSDQKREDLELKGRYEMWIFHGQLEKEDMEAAGSDLGEAEDPYVSAMVMVVNNHVIKATRNLLETGEYPYDVMVWRAMSGTWTGIGVARQIRTAQKIYTASYRNLMDNAGLAAGPMIVFKQGVVRPSDGVAGLAPRKVYIISKDDDTIQDATKAIGSIKIDMMVDELLKIAQDAVKMAEDTTGLPMLIQGQMGSAPDTVGGMSMLMNNASAVLRRLAKTFDDRVVKRGTRRDYVYLLQYGEDDDLKDNYLVEARGSSALVERDMQNQYLNQMGQMVLDPRYGVDPKKWMFEWLKSIHYDTRKLEYSDDAWENMLQNWEQMMQAMAEQDNGDGVKLQIAEMNGQIKQFIAQIQSADKAADRDMTGAIAVRTLEQESEENALDRQLTGMEFTFNQQVDGMKLSGSIEENRETIKAMLAKEVMKIRSTERLVGMEAKAAQLPKPPVEPPGKAESGESYTQ